MSGTVRRAVATSNRDACRSDAERVAHLDEARGLVPSGSSQSAGHVQRLVGQHPDGPALDTGQGRDQLGSELLAQEDHRIEVGQGGDDRAHIVG